VGGAIAVRAEPSGFGAEITGLDISRPLPPETLAAVKQAWADHSVMWFPDQPLDHDQLEAFTLQFGAFGNDPYVAPLKDRRHILEVRREPDETTSPFGAAWHSDWSFQDASPAATLLHAKVIPPVGGDTLYADGYRAFEALSPAMQDILTSLRGVHSAARPYGPQGAYAKEAPGRSMTILWSAEAEKTHSHPIVRTHPVSGRRALFVNPVYTVGIEGMTEAESAALLGFLFKHMTADEFVHRHAWSANMLTMWDNRCALHNATGGYDGHLRVLHRTTVAGDTPV
jgi:taurine dioxygenase